MDRKITYKKCLTFYQKNRNETTDIFNSIFNKPLNLSSHIITNDVILNGKEVINTEIVLKMKMVFSMKNYSAIFVTSHIRKRN